MIRPIYEILGHVVHARYEMESLKHRLVEEMRSGYRPTHRGHEVSREMFDVIDATSACIEVSFHLLKGLQFPEALVSRLEDARSELNACSVLAPSKLPT